MADEIINLTRPASKFDPPFFLRNLTGKLGTESVFIYPKTFVNTPTIWIPLFIKTTLITDATVANRNIVIRRYSLTGIVTTLQSVNVTASLTKSLHCGGFDENMMTDCGLSAEYSAYLGSPGSLVNGLLIDSSAKDNYLKISINNGVAGDSYNISMQFIYMNKILGLPNVYDDNDTPFWQRIRS